MTASWVELNQQRQCTDTGANHSGGWLEDYQSPLRPIQYDGFGNRVSITQAGNTITYSYDARQRVVSASNGETWQNDALGNNTYHRAAKGDMTTTTYDAENRALTTSFSKVGP